MNKLLANLFSGNTRFFLDKTDFTNYAILYAMAQLDNEYAAQARSILARAKEREPMDLDLEADKLYMGIFYATIRQ